MKKLSGHITKEQAYSLIEKHKGMTERKIIIFGNKHNTHKCILWSDYREEIDTYGTKSYNKYVIDEFYWKEEIKELSNK